jgi:hypothetical protein
MRSGSVSRRHRITARTYRINGGTLTVTRGDYGWHGMIMWTAPKGMPPRRVSFGGTEGWMTAPGLWAVYASRSLARLRQNAARALHRQMTRDECA